MSTYAPAWLSCPPGEPAPEAELGLGGRRQDDRERAVPAVDARVGGAGDERLGLAPTDRRRGASGGERGAGLQVAQAERLDAHAADVGVADLDLDPVELHAVGGVHAHGHIAGEPARAGARAALEHLRQRDAQREHGAALVGALGPAEPQRGPAGDGHAEGLAARREADRLLLVALHARGQLEREVALEELDPGGRDRHAPHGEQAVGLADRFLDHRGRTARDRDRQAVQAERLRGLPHRRLVRPGALQAGAAELDEREPHHLLASRHAERAAGGRRVGVPGRIDRAHLDGVRAAAQRGGREPGGVARLPGDELDVLLGPRIHAALEPAARFGGPVAEPRRAARAFLAFLRAGRELGLRGGRVDGERAPRRRLVDLAGRGDGAHLERGRPVDEGGAW
ncbi:MAG: hypothetical protein PGN13_15400 [Patulibacter minatonensis]